MNNDECLCPSCVERLTSNIHQNDEYRIDAVTIKRDIDWNRLPRLRKIFEHRPSVNNHWHELVYLIKKASGLIDCNCKSIGESQDDKNLETYRKNLASNKVDEND